MPATRTLANYLASLDTVAAPAGADGYVLYDDSAADVVRQTQTQRAAVDAAQYAPITPSMFLSSAACANSTTGATTQRSHLIATVPGVGMVNAAAGSEIGFTVGFTIPPGWATATAKYLVAYSNAGAGNVRASLQIAKVVPGTAVTPTTIAASATIVPAAATNVPHYLATTAAFAVTPGDACYMRIIRECQDAADTNTGNLHFMGVLLERAS